MDTTNPEDGRASGPTAGYDSNLTPENPPDQEKKGGIKGIMSKIGDKLGPGHPGVIESSPSDHEAAKGANVFHEQGLGQTDRHGQANADLNRE